MNAACSHLTVTYRTYEGPNRSTYGYWTCKDCEKPFLPVSEAVDRKERNFQLLQAAVFMGGLPNEVGRWSVPLREAIERAEAILELIETRNAPHLPIQNTGF